MNDLFQPAQVTREAVLLSAVRLQVAAWLLLAGVVPGSPCAEEIGFIQSESGNAQVSSRSQRVSPTLKIVPDSVAIALGEPQIFRLKDSKGVMIPDAQWSVSDPKIVHAQLGREARLTGLQAGHVTLTATWKGLRAEAQVRIYEFVGLDPSPSAAGTSGPSAPDSGQAETSSPPPLDFKMRVTPDIMGMVVGEMRRVRLNDAAGKMVRDATWTVSDPRIVRLEPSAEPALMAVAEGMSFVTAHWHGEIAEAKVTVFAGPELPQGTVRWSVAALPGFVTKTTGQSLVLSPEGADFTTVEYDKFGRWMTRGLTSDGRELWATQIDFKQKKANPRNPDPTKRGDAQTDPAAPPHPR